MSTRVLLIDDDTALQELLAELLSASGMQVTVAPEPKGALSLLEAAAFDLVLCDQNLGEGLKGTHLFQQAKGRGLAANLTWVLLTGMSPKSLEGQGFTVIQKPFELNALIDLVRSKAPDSAKKEVPPRAKRPSAELVTAYDFLESEQRQRVEGLPAIARKLGVGR